MMLMVELVVEVVFVLLVLLDEELVDVVDDNVLEEDELDVVVVELVVEVVFVLLVLLDEELVDVVDDNVLEGR